MFDKIPANSNIGVMMFCRDLTTKDHYNFSRVEQTMNFISAVNTDELIIDIYAIRENTITIANGMGRILNPRVDDTEVDDTVTHTPRVLATNY